MRARTHSLPRTVLTSLTDEVYQLVSEWAIQERRCCPFFDISLRLEPEGGPLWLILTGRPGTKDFIKVDGAAWIKR